MKKFMLLSILLIIVAGCSTTPQNEANAKDKIVCNSPYIRMGLGCCLDSNDNNICDKDETEKQVSNSNENSNDKEQLRCKEPYINTGGKCCLDENRDSVCDAKEDRKSVV